ncbi:hypothetical protein HY449_02495 [Candidatus Pacearchaeota archaeon]|nr:hypothetical protein [Candidatus Pacearchaeota archaeon]
MPEILQFPIHEAYAEYDGDSLKIKLFYPCNPNYVQNRLPANLEHGVDVLEKLLLDGYAQIADRNNPVSPPSAGSIIILNDGSFICHRRDKKAPIHKLYHSTSSGSPNDKRSLFTQEGLLETALRETAEETLLLSHEGQVVTTEFLRKHTLESLERIEVDYLTRTVDGQFGKGKDLLEVYRMNKKILSVHCFLDLIFDVSTSISALHPIILDISSNEIISLDLEGDIVDGRFAHFNRESFILHPREIENLNFAEPITNPRVFQSKIKNKKFEIYSSAPTENLGPGGIAVKHPYLFSPDDLLTSALDGLGIPGYHGKKLNIELWKEKTILGDKNRREHSLINRRYLGK